MVIKLQAHEVLTMVTRKHPNLLSDFLRSMRILSDKEMVMVILDTIEHLFSLDRQFGLTGHEPTSFYSILDNAQCLDILEELLKSGNRLVVDRVEQILDKYLPNSDEEGMEEVKVSMD